MTTEKLDGRIDRIVDDMAIIIFDTPEGKLERMIEVSKLEAIQADHQGALIRLSVIKENDYLKITLENREKSGEETWRDKITEKSLEKFDLLKKFAIPPKSSELE